MKKRWMKLFVAALLCVGILGCGLFVEEVTTTVDDVRSSGTVVAILDDSLVILDYGYFFKKDSYCSQR